jgi:hypothetical protein
MYTIDANHDLHCFVLASWGAGRDTVYQSDDYLDAALFAADSANGRGYTLVIVCERNLSC